MLRKVAWQKVTLFETHATTNTSLSLINYVIRVTKQQLKITFAIT
jgi:hypothetical protein